MIKSMGKGHLFGLMAKNTQVNGKTVNNMEKDYTLTFKG
jgi:hypothetical protein